MSSLARTLRAITLGTLGLSSVFRRASFYSFADAHIMPRTETTGRNMQTVHPDDGTHSATVIVLHGLGDSSDGWIDVAQRWHRAMPWAKFIVPSARSRPITMNGGFTMPGWYDIVGLDDRAGESCDGIEESVAEIRQIMDAEKATGVPYSRMVLAGFSQGGALSLFGGLQLPVEQKPGGILIMSGYCPGYSKFSLTPGLEDVPLLHCHGTVRILLTGRRSRTRRKSPYIPVLHAPPTNFYLFSFPFALYSHACRPTRL